MITIRNRRQFEVSLDQFAKQIGVDVVTVVKKLSFDIFHDVVAGTPIDTGRAMNNWNIAIGSPPRLVTQEVGTAAGIAGTKAVRAGSVLNSVKPFDTVWISNSVPYIVALEEGHSKQAPNGWVARAVDNNLRAITKFKLR